MPEDSKDKIALFYAARFGRNLPEIERPCKIHFDDSPPFSKKGGFGKVLKDFWSVPCEY